MTILSKIKKVFSIGAPQKNKPITLEGLMGEISKMSPKVFVFAHFPSIELASLAARQLSFIKPVMGQPDKMVIPKDVRLGIFPVGNSPLAPPGQDGGSVVVGGNLSENQAKEAIKVFAKHGQMQSAMGPGQWNLERLK